ncbi:hypothetical protein JCM12178A_23770 [Salidesulfovibrio brasiliensis]
MSNVINRHGVAQLLGTTPAAISCRVSRRDWSAVPEPFKIGRGYYWLKDKVEEWLYMKAGQGLQGPQLSRKKGRPRKGEERRSAC